MNRVTLLALVVLLLSSAPVVAQTPQGCEALRSLPLANTVVTVATVMTGSFIPPGSSNPNATIANLPSFCRVAATLKPTSDSEINTEI